MLLLAQLGRAQETYEQMIHHFDYNQSAPLDLKESNVEERDGVKIHDISYASPMGGRVPAYLIVPSAKVHSRP